MFKLDSQSFIITRIVDHDAARDVAAAVNGAKEGFGNVVKVSVGHDRAVHEFEVTTVWRLDASDEAAEANRSGSTRNILERKL